LKRSAVRDSLISHDHYDHPAEPAVRRLAHAFNPRFVMPLGIKAWLPDRGIVNVTELDWADSITLNGIQIVCTPAQYGSGGRSPTTDSDSGRPRRSSGRSASTLLAIAATPHICV
jgi:L-ascorbate metabolism protein UlaG (beta-lactamase superfamily)